MCGRTLARILPPQVSMQPANLSFARGFASTSNSARSRTLGEQKISWVGRKGNGIKQAGSE